MDKNDIVIISAKRTPMGGFQGDFSDISCAALGSTAIKAALEEAGVQPHDIDSVIMGCVLPAGQGQAPARQASLGAGLPQHTGATTVNKMCGSGMKALMIAHDEIKAGSHTIMIAGGMENMSGAPYLLPKARGGYRMGHGAIKDSMFLDGLEDAYEHGTLMGVYAERCAGQYNFTREAQDDFAITSLTRAQNAIKDGSFTSEIAPVTLQTRKGDLTIDTDEQPGKANLDKIPALRPAFAKDGTVTAANASSISDGAAALLVMKRSEAEQRKLNPLATLKAHATFAHAPEWFTTAPVHALKKLSEKTGWDLDEVDLFEINEAFAVVTMAAIKDLNLPADKVNIHGGACALGHPIGASGARIVVTLIHALKQKGLKKGMAALCLGGGEAVAVAVEMCP
ncbi:MAG: acetyl-CoA C-acyltransferase [Micavibrio sp.]|nr:acetyl-CoA C-acyltransferase [Micavibrio sp.]